MKGAKLEGRGAVREESSGLADIPCSGYRPDWSIGKEYEVKEKSKVEGSCGLNCKGHGIPM